MLLIDGVADDLHQDQLLRPVGIKLGMNLRKTKQFEAVTPESFQALGLQTQFGPDDARMQAMSAVERILSNWPILNEFLSVDKFSMLSKRLNTLPIVKRQ